LGSVNNEGERGVVMATVFGFELDKMFGGGETVGDGSEHEGTAKD
jgi:hypothetical protein